ncbi:MAG TPA: Ig-like domain repeat protein [Acidobacteriaceae bacterium]|jgi:hypothetical protein
MMKGLHILTSVLTCLGTAAAVAAQTPSTVSPPGQPAPAGYGLLPLTFEPNHGQTSPAVQWISRGPDYAFLLTGHDAVLQLYTAPSADDGKGKKPAGDVALRMNLLGARSAPSSAGEDPQPGRANYFTGNKPSQWQRDVPMFGRVRLPQVYPGIDLVYYGSQGHLEYDFVLAPGADVSQIRLGFEGATADLDPTGNLILPIAGRRIQFDKPVIYQMRDGRREPVAGKFALAKNHQVTFRLGAYDRSRELIIDPTLLFVGTLATGNQPTLPQGMAVTAAGEMIFTGRTYDLAFPVTTGAYQTDCGTAAAGNSRCGVSSFSSAFVTKISADGTHLLYSTYLHGGQGEENGVAVAVDSTGVVYLTGTTTSSDFPITADAYQSFCSPIGLDPDPVTGVFKTQSSQCYTVTAYGPQFGGPSTYVVKLNATGDQILYGTFLGGSNATAPAGIAVDADGNFYVATSTSSAQNNPQGSEEAFPITPSAYQTQGVEGGFSATLSKFSPDGHTLLYSSYLGAPEITGRSTFAGALTLARNGIVFLGGYTSAADFPTTPGVIKTVCVVLPADSTSCEGAGGFVAAFDTSKSGKASLVYSTLINGTQAPFAGAVETAVQALAADNSNNLYVTGHTYSNDFPTTTGAFQTTCNYANSSGHCDAAFIAKINPTGTALLWSTYYGSTGSAGGVSAYAIALDAASRIFVYGYSLHGDANLPQVNPVQPFQQGDKVFVATFSPDGSQLLFGTRFGGVATESNEEPVTKNGIAVDDAGNIFFGGSTQNGAFPVTSGAFTSPLVSGAPRGFFVKLSPQLAPLPTASTLTISPQTAATGQPITFTSVVSASTTGAVPTGTVTFLDGGTTVATVPVDATGTAVYTTSSLVPGNYTVTAAYGGDSNFASSGSAPQMLTIALPLTPSIALILSATAITPGTNVTLTATLTGSGATPTGTVMFMDGGATLATATLDPSGTAGTSSTSLALGTHALSVKYAGDAIYGAAQSPVQTLSVSTIPTTTTLTATPTSVPPGTAVLLTATVVQGSGSTVPPGTVTFLDGSTALGTGTLSAAGMATLSTSTLAAGAHSITATYAGSATFSSSVSTVQTVTVTAPLVPSIAFTLSTNSATPGTNVTLAATFTGSGATPTGTVMFMDGSAILVTATLDPSGTASFSSTTFALGTHALSVKYAGDTVYGPLQSPPQTLTVSTIATTTTLTGAPAYAKAGITVILTATIVQASGTTVPSGTITFLDGATVLGAGTLSASGVATLSTDTLSVGTHSVTASYAGTAIFSGSVSNPQTVTVTTPLAPALVLTLSQTSPFPGDNVTLTATLTGSGPTPTGTIMFFDGSSLINTATVNPAGVTTFINSFTAGTHALSAKYAGDNLYGPAQTVPQNLMAKFETFVELTAAIPDPPPGGSVVLTTVVIDEGGSDSPGGTVTFFEGSTAIGSAVLSPGVAGTGVATFTVSNLSIGHHDYRDTYNGSDKFIGGQGGDATINVPAIANNPVSLSASANPSGLGSPLFLAATFPSIFFTRPPTGTVDFYDGSTLIGSGSIMSKIGFVTSANYTTSTLPLGAHSLTAVYRGDPYYSGSTSPAVVVTVANPDIMLAANQAVTIDARTTVASTTLTATPYALTERTYLNLNFCGSEAGFTCTFSTPTLSFDPGDLPQTAQVTVTEIYPISGKGQAEGSTYMACMLLPILGGLGLAGATRRKKLLTNLRRKNSLLLAAVLSLSALMTLNGCAVPPAPATLKPGTYLLGIVATRYNLAGSTPINTVVVTANITIIVQ